MMLVEIFMVNTANIIYLSIPVASQSTRVLFLNKTLASRFAPIVKLNLKRGGTCLELSGNLTS